MLSCRERAWPRRNPRRARPRLLARQFRCSCSGPFDVVLDERREAFQALRPPAAVGVAVFGRPEDRLVERELRLSLLVLERDGHDRVVEWLAFRVLAVPGEDDSLWLDDLAVDAPDPVVFA